MRTLEESMLLQLLPERLKEQCIIFLTRGVWRNIWTILNLRTVQVEVV